ncbi:hypothetical protein A5743_14385 [Mycolicibacterium conceptionense]|nr:hypothetical protein A5743_14385 [Mycolicibacterium conceptionense]
MLPRGQRRTVEVTDYVRKLVKIGAAKVVAGNLDEPDAVAYGDEPTRSEILDEMAAEAAENDSYSQVAEFPVEDAEPAAEESKPRRTRGKTSGES